jgi:Skp family chaperone for outer membrane proteins
MENSPPAQVSGIAIASITSVVAGTKAYAAALQQIATTYKGTFDQIEQRRAALLKESEPLLAQLGTIKDNNVSEEEVEASRTAEGRMLNRLKMLKITAEEDIARLNNGAARAEFFAIESISRQFEAAQKRVVNAKKISLVLSPEVVMYAPDSANISAVIAAEIDKFAPTVGIQPPADWEPSRETVAMQQQFSHWRDIRAYQAAQQQRAATLRPAGTPRAAPARPPEPR